MRLKTCGFVGSTLILLMFLSLSLLAKNASTPEDNLLNIGLLFLDPGLAKEDAASLAKKKIFPDVRG